MDCSPGLLHCRRTIYCLSHKGSSNCSPPGSSIHGIFLARLLEWVAISLVRGSSRPKDRTHISCVGSRFFTTEPPGKPLLFSLYSPPSEEQSAPDESLNSHLSRSLSFVPQTLRLLVVPQDLYPTGPAIPCLSSNPSLQAQQGVRRIISDRMGPYSMTGSFRIL